MTSSGVAKGMNGIGRIAGLNESSSSGENNATTGAAQTTRSGFNGRGLGDASGTISASTGAAATPQRGFGAIIMERSLGALGDPLDSANAAAFGPILVGLGVSAAGGAAVGGLAAGSWKGATIGAGLNVAIWSLLALGGSWATLDTKNKAILGGATLLGAGFSGYSIYKRSKK